MNRMVSKFPTPNEIPQPIQKGFIGINATLYTIDGNSYYPTVVNVVDGMPAKRKGIELEDMIVNINGIDTRNMPIAKFLDLCKGDEGSQVELQVWRVNKLLNFTLTRTAKNWK